MRIRNLSATLCVAISALLLVPIAGATTPTTVNVRIEGATETLFEGPLSVVPHSVKATSDTVERPCDGINALDPENIVPGPTPTSAADDAMSLIGETFDGLWYPGYNDYFIKRFGPDAEKEGKSWGILVNDTFLAVGGCQYELDGGDEVLWAYDAFGVRPFLALFPAAADYTSGARPLTATATLGQPFEVEVVSYADHAEDTPPAQPGRSGSSAFAGADVSPVTTSTKGFEKVETGSSETVTTNSQGKASITFTTPGWHRIKATVPGAGEEEAIRSNRLDVCVPAVGENGCGALPPEDEVRVPQATAEGPALEGKEREAGEQREREERARREKETIEAAEREARQAPPVTAQSSPTPAGPAAATTPPPISTPGAIRISVPKVDPKTLKRDRVSLTWKVLDAGAGVRGWTISSQALGGKKAAYVKRASGKAGTSALLRLAPGAYRLRLTVTDARGRTATVTTGKVVVPGGGRG